MQTTLIRLSARARALVISELERASANTVLDLAEMRERRAGPGVIQLLDDTLSALADVREQLSAPDARERVA